MLDIKAIRDDPEPFRKGLARRNLSDAVDELLAADEHRRALIGRVEALRTEQNRASKAIGGAQGDEKQRLIDAVSSVSTELKALEPELEAAEAALTELLAKTPNIPHESAPDGFTDEDALEVRRHGEPTAFDFEPRDHAALGELLGVMDIERAVRTFGFALRVPARRHRAAAVRARPARARHLDGQRVHAGDPAGAGARGSDVRNRVPAHRRSAAVRDARGRPVPGRHERGAARRAAHDGDRGSGRPAVALRRLLHVLPSRGRHLRQGHGRHVPRPPVRQGGDVLVHHAGDLLGRARDAGLDRRGDRRQPRDPVPRGEHRRGRPRAARPRRSTTSRAGCRRSSATAS